MDTARYYKEQGYADFMAGVHRSACPHPLGSPAAENWLIGWDRAAADQRKIEDKWARVR